MKTMFLSYKEQGFCPQSNSVKGHEYLSIEVAILAAFCCIVSVQVHVSNQGQKIVRFPIRHLSNQFIVE